MRAGVRCFVLVGVATGHEQLASNFLKAMPKLARFLAKHRGPFIAKIFRDGTVEMGLDYKSWQVRDPFQ